MAFAALLTRIEAGIYIAVALVWLVAVEGTVPDRWDGRRLYGMHPWRADHPSRAALKGAAPTKP
jgi:hypothetical protein